MTKLTALVLAVAAAFIGGESNATAGIITFEEKPAFSVDSSGLGQSGDLQYSFGFATVYYSPVSPADFPTPITSTVMANGYTDITFSKIGGGQFSVQTVDLAFGPFSHNGASSDITMVTGNLVGGGALTTSLAVSYGFKTYSLNWSGLESITFSSLVNYSEYLAFDNIAGAVPEPSAIVCFGLVGLSGLLIRRRKTVFQS